MSNGREDRWGRVSGSVGERRGMRKGYRGEEDDERRKRGSGRTEKEGQRQSIKHRWKEKKCEAE